MSDIKLFHLKDQKATEVVGVLSVLEKPLQSLIETNLDSLLGIRFLASEYSTGKTHAGRIDTLGLDENNCPVIIEYKRSSHENIINQGLFYLDWLMDHQAEFKLLVLENFGKPAADKIDWTAPRLLCIAADFTKYDSHAVQQMDRNIELIRYRQFGKELLLLELVNAVAVAVVPAKKGKKGTGPDKSVSEWFSDMSPELRNLFDSIEAFLLSLGDDVQRKDVKLYVAFKRLRNFATIVFQKNKLLVFLHVDPDTTDPIAGITRDVREIGHWGTGSLELTIGSPVDLEKSKPLLIQAYNGDHHAA